jgi:predicted MFS family arabinose efflux permease
MIGIYFLGIGAFASMTAIFPLFLEERFGIDESTVGYVFVYVGSVSVLVRGLAVGKLVRWFGEPHVCRVGAVMLGVGMAVGTIADTYPLLAVAITLVAAGTGTLFPPLAALLSRASAPEEQGSTLGLNQFFGGVARVAGPLWGAAVFDAYGPGAPFLTAALGVGIALLMAFGLRPAAQSQRAAAAGSAVVGTTSAGERRGPG